MNTQDIIAALWSLATWQSAGWHKCLIPQRKGQSYSRRRHARYQGMFSRDSPSEEHYGGEHCSAPADDRRAGVDRRGGISLLHDVYARKIPQAIEAAQTQRWPRLYQTHNLCRARVTVCKAPVSHIVQSPLFGRSSCNTVSEANKTHETPFNHLFPGGYHATLYPCFLSRP